MIVMDSTGWLEMFLGGPRADDFSRRLDEAEAVLVPTIAIYEVYKVLRREASEEAADEGTGQMRLQTLVPLDDILAMEAADYSLRHALPMADAVLYATARAYGAMLVTSDRHFDGLPGVDYIASVKD